MYFESDIAFEKVDVSLYELLFINVQFKLTKLGLILVYIPPASISGIMKQFEYIFSNNNLETSTLISGDFNINWNWNSVLKENFETLMSLNNFKQLINQFIRVNKISATIIDLMCTNSLFIITRFDVLKYDLSDHFTVKFKINLHVQWLKPTFLYIIKRDFKKFNESEFFNTASYMDLSSFGGWVPRRDNRNSR